MSRLLVVGVGLIGGSLALAARRAGVCQQISGFGRQVAHLERAVQLGVIDRYHTSLADALQDADIVVLSVPLQAMTQLLIEMLPDLAEHTVVTDVGSAKRSVVEVVQQHWGARSKQFVPGHPIAGTEHSGVDAAFAELFEAKRVILTPVPETDVKMLEQVRALWAACGAQVSTMDAEHHDEVLARTSHLPHLLAFNLVDTLDQVQRSDEIFRYSAGGFRDFTRIASSDPVMWRDILLANDQAILSALAQYKHGLEEIETLLKRRDGKSLEALFLRAKTARDRYYARQEKQPTDSE